MTADEIRAQAAASIAGAASSSTVATGALPAPVTSQELAPAPASDNAPADPQQVIAALQRQLAQALGVLSSLQPAAAAVIAGGKRRYHSNQPFVRIGVMRRPGHCEMIQFLAHELITEDPATIQYIEEAIMAGNNNFSHKPFPTESAEERELKKDQMALASVHHKKLVAAGEKTG